MPLTKTATREVSVEVSEVLLLDTLGKELARRELWSLLESCRRTYQAQSRMERDAPWTPGHVKRLMGLLQLAPYDRVYRLRSQLHCCERCGPGRAFDELLVDDRHLTTCGGCGTSWIVLHL